MSPLKVGNDLTETHGNLPVTKEETTMEKLGIPTKDLQAHFVRTSISDKKYNISYFLNIPDKPMIFLFIPTFIFVNTALEFI